MQLPLDIAFAGYCESYVASCEIVKLLIAAGAKDTISSRVENIECANIEVHFIKQFMLVTKCIVRGEATTHTA